MYPANGCSPLAAEHNESTSAISRKHQEALKVSESSKRKCHKILAIPQSDQDLLRIIGQYLSSLGLKLTANQLLEETGLSLEHPHASKLRQHVMNGHWDKAIEDLHELRSYLQSPRELPTMKFFILEEKYLEFVEDGKLLEALTCLRQELATLELNTERVHFLSSLLMCTDDLRKLAKWEGKGANSRKKLMEKLQSFLPPNLMLPPGRLRTLVHQAIQYQISRCHYHNYQDGISLDSTSILTDHSCCRGNLPCKTVQTLDAHNDDVWFCRFSNNGTKLLSGSKDGTVVIWDVDIASRTVKLRSTFRDHSYGVSCAAWSPDDRFVAVCGGDDCGDLWIWDSEKGELHKKISPIPEDTCSLTCVAWSPDGRKIVVGGTRGQFYICDLDGTIIDFWEGIRVQCLLWHPTDPNLVLAADTHRRIRAYNFDEKKDYPLITEDHPIMTFSTNRSGSLAILNVATQGVNLWDLNAKSLVRRFRGLVQGKFTIYSCFGGMNERFIASGSEDSKIYIWHVDREAPVSVLEGHNGPVNCVSWNPAIPSMLASASEDGYLRIWGPNVSDDDELEC